MPLGPTLPSLIPGKRHIKGELLAYQTGQSTGGSTSFSSTSVPVDLAIKPMWLTVPATSFVECVFNAMLSSLSVVGESYFNLLLVDSITEKQLGAMRGGGAHGDRQLRCTIQGPLYIPPGKYLVKLQAIVVSGPTNWVIGHDNDGGGTASYFWAFWAVG